MAVFTYEQLQGKYGYFDNPEVMIKVGNNELTGKKGFPVGDVVVDLTSGYEASVAEFSIYDTYNLAQNEFMFDAVKKFILIGSKVEISMGYKKKTTLVFVGVITRVNFLFETVGVPCVRVTAMDVKGVMMAGSYARQLKATNYSDAVSEIFKKTAYNKLKNSGVIKKIVVQATADKQQVSASAGVGAVPGKKQTTDKTIEMVAESDYEFVVKAGKRNNYEFYTDCGNVVFRKAKANNKILMEIAPTMGLRSFDISYDITGIVDKVIVRGMDVSKAKSIKSEKKLSNKLSQGNNAKQVISGSQKVYLDSTVSSKEDADARAASLAEKISYRYGSMTCEMIGIPILKPGYFIKLYGLGTGADNKFYLTKVRHVYDTDGRYLVTLEGVSDSAGGTEMDSLDDLGSLAGLGDMGGLEAIGDFSDMDSVGNLAGGFDDLGDLGDMAGDLGGLAGDLGGLADAAGSVGDAIGGIGSLF